MNSASNSRRKFSWFRDCSRSRKDSGWRLQRRHPRAAGQVDCVVVYKVDRLSRSLLDFARLVEVFDAHGVSFVSVTQPINTADSTGRLMLNILLSFAQFERETIADRTRDKMSAARRRGKWTGGLPCQFSPEGRHPFSRDR